MEKHNREVRLTGTFKKDLQVLRNGMPVSGSDTEPAQKIKIASYILFALGGFAILVGLFFMAIFPEMGNLPVWMKFSCFFDLTLLGSKDLFIVVPHDFVQRSIMLFARDMKII